VTAHARPTVESRACTLVHPPADLVPGGCTHLEPGIAVSTEDQGKRATGTTGGEVQGSPKAPAVRNNEPLLHGGPQ